MSTCVNARAPQLLVRRLSDSARTGVLQCGSLRVACALGRGGVRVSKREGDGATPWGRMVLVSVMFKPRASLRVVTALPLRAVRPGDGWCDAAGDRNYNRPVRLPYPARTEQLWRNDGLYDIVAVLDYNLRPRVQGRGSAIFMHVARPGYLPTEGCIALTREDLIKVLARVRRGSAVVTSR